MQAGWASLRPLPGRRSTWMWWRGGSRRRDAATGAAQCLPDTPPCCTSGALTLAVRGPARCALRCATRSSAPVQRPIGGHCIDLRPQPRNSNPLVAQRRGHAPRQRRRLVVAGGTAAGQHLLAQARVIRSNGLPSASLRAAARQDLQCIVGTAAHRGQHGQPFDAVLHPDRGRVVAQRRAVHVQRRHGLVGTSAGGKRMTADGLRAAPAAPPGARQRAPCKRRTLVETTGGRQETAQVAFAGVPCGCDAGNLFERRVRRVGGRYGRFEVARLLGELHLQPDAGRASWGIVRPFQRQRFGQRRSRAAGSPSVASDQPSAASARAGGAACRRRAPGPQLRVSGAAARRCRSRGAPRLPRSLQQRHLRRGGPASRCGRSADSSARPRRPRRPGEHGAVNAAAGSSARGRRLRAPNPRGAGVVQLGDRGRHPVTLSAGGSPSPQRASSLAA